MLTGIFFLALLVFGRKYFRVPLLPVALVEAVPGNIALWLELPQLDHITNSSGIPWPAQWKDLVVSVPDLSAQWEPFQAWMMSSKPGKTLAGARTLVLLQEEGGNVIGMTMVVDLRKLGRFRLDDWIGATSGKISRSVYRGRPIVRLDLPQGGSLAAGLYRNLLIISRRPLEVEEIIAHLRRPGDSFRWSAAWQVMKNGQAGGRSFSVFLRPPLFRDLLGALRSQQPANGSTADIPALWECLRLDLSPDTSGYWKIRGFGYPAGTPVQGELPSSLAGASELKNSLPAGVALVQRWTLEDPPRFYAGHNGARVDRFRRFFLPWIDREMAFVVVDPQGFPDIRGKAWLLRFGEEKAAAKALGEWMQEAGVMVTDSYQTFPLTQVVDEGLFRPVAGALGDLRNPWVTFLGPYVLLTDARPTLENWIDQYLVGNVLSRSGFDPFAGDRWSPVSRQFFIDAGLWLPVLRAMFRDQSFAEAIGGLGVLSADLKVKKRTGRIEGTYRPAGESRTVYGVAWRTPLEGDVIFGPCLLHDRQGAGYLAMLDNKSGLNLLEPGGRLRWRIALEGQPLATPQAIDIDGDGQQEVFCNTDKALYVFDLQGQALPPFPILPGLTFTNSALPVDFGHHHEYTFFVAAGNGCIYGYDEAGYPVAGWNPRCDSGLVAFPLVHLQTSDRDFLFALSTQGRLSVFDREGKPRFPPLEWEGLFLSPPAGQVQENSGRLVVCDAQGVARVVNLEGEVFQLSLAVGRNESVSFVFGDFSGDERNDYLVAEGEEIAMYSYSDRGFEKRFIRSLDMPVSGLQAVAWPGRQKVLSGVYSREKRKILLLDEQGKMLPGFPLAGETPFMITDLNKGGELLLVVGFGDEVFAYRPEALQ